MTVDPEELFVANQPRLFRYFVRAVGHIETARDLTQDVFDGDATLDIYGILNARPGSNGVAVSVETRSRWTPEKRSIAGPQRFLNSDLQLKPDETVDIRLPPLGDDAGVFAKRALSIRIRARQLH